LSREGKQNTNHIQAAEKQKYPRENTGEVALDARNPNSFATTTHTGFAFREFRTIKAVTRRFIPEN
jgi:hypothetical protein